MRLSNPLVRRGWGSPRGVWPGHARGGHELLLPSGACRVALYRVGNRTALTATDIDHSDSSQSDEADHEEESAARKVHLLLSEIPAPAWQDIVMDRTA